MLSRRDKSPCVPSVEVFCVLCSLLAWAQCFKLLRSGTPAFYQPPAALSTVYTEHVAWLVSQLVRCTGPGFLITISTQEVLRA